MLRVFLLWLLDFPRFLDPLCCSSSTSYQFLVTSWRFYFLVVFMLLVLTYYNRVYIDTWGLQVFLGLLWGCVSLQQRTIFREKNLDFPIGWKRERTERRVWKLTKKSLLTIAMLFFANRCGVALSSSHSLFSLCFLVCSARSVVLMKSDCRYNTHITIFLPFQGCRYFQPKTDPDGLSKDRRVSIEKGK